MNPKELSDRIIAGILKKPDVSYSTLEAHANKLGISVGIFQTAMVLVHRDKTVYGRMKRGEIVYAPKIKKEPPKPPKQPDYPIMEEGMNDGDPITFYWPEHDGPTPVHGPEYRAFLRKKNEDLKRAVDSEKFSRV